MYVQKFEMLLLFDKTVILTRIIDDTDVLPCEGDVVVYNQIEYVVERMILDYDTNTVKAIVSATGSELPRLSISSDAPPHIQGG